MQSGALVACGVVLQHGVGDSRLVGRREHVRSGFLSVSVR